MRYTMLNGAARRDLTAAVRRCARKVASGFGEDACGTFRKELEFRIWCALPAALDAPEFQNVLQIIAEIAWREMNPNRQRQIRLNLDM